MASQTMIKPQQIDGLPFLDATQKQQYKNGLASLWREFEAASEGSPQKADYRSRIVTASTRIMQQISQRTRPANGNQQPRPQNGQPAVNGGGAAANLQAQQTQQAQAQQLAQQQQRTQQASQNQQNGQQNGDPDAAIKDRLTIEINRIVVAPPENCANQQQYEQYKQTFKSTLGGYRFKAEKAKDQAENLARQMLQMQQMGQQPPEETQQRLATLRNAMNTFGAQAKNMMETNARNTDAAQARKTQNRQDPPRPPTQSGLPNQQDTASPIQPSRPPTAQSQIPRTMPQPTPIQQPQRPPQAAQSFAQQYPSAPNSAVPGSAGAAQRPHALSQQGAIAKAQEQNNQQSVAAAQSAVQGNMPFNHTPVAGTPTSAMPQQPPNINTKFPIPKALSLGPQSQTPVNGAPARPTIMNHGMMGQPGLQRAPQITLEGEGAHVMSSRKLNELVRQVTGSADPADGLTPEVEEMVLSMTDNFVDDVITRACQLAKLRPGQTLDIRDVQMVLERNYGLRIPGYSLDETRTVRKFNPSPNWVAKVQSVQASKLTRGE